MKSIKKKSLFLESEENMTAVAVALENEVPNVEIAKLYNISTSNVSLFKQTAEAVKSKTWTRCAPPCRNHIDFWCKRYGEDADAIFDLFVKQAYANVNNTPPPQAPKAPKTNEDVYLLKVLEALTELTEEIRALRKDTNANFDNEYKLIDGLRQKIDRRK